MKNQFIVLSIMLVVGSNSVASTIVNQNEIDNLCGFLSADVQYSSYMVNEAKSALKSGASLTGNAYTISVNEVTVTITNDIFEDVPSATYSLSYILDILGQVEKSINETAAGEFPEPIEICK